MQNERVEFLTKEIVKCFPPEVEVNNIIIAKYMQYTILVLKLNRKNNFFHFHRLFGKELTLVNLVERVL